MAATRRSCSWTFWSACKQNPPPGLYVILTMRSEFLGVCARFEGLAGAVNRTQYLLPQMERPALMRAIREPATLYDGEVTRELAEGLMADAGSEQDQLPLIQHGLMRLWRRKVGPPPARDSGLAEAGAPFRQDNALADASVPFRHETRSEEPAARPAHQADDAPLPFLTIAVRAGDLNSRTTRAAASPRCCRTMPTR